MILRERMAGWARRSKLLAGGGGELREGSSSRGEDGGQPLVHRQLDGRAVRHQVPRLVVAGAGIGLVAPRDHLPVRVDDTALGAAAHAQARLDPDRLHLSSFVRVIYFDDREFRDGVGRVERMHDGVSKRTLKYSTHGEFT
jgi:hypothetical protein